MPSSWVTLLLTLNFSPFFALFTLKFSLFLTLRFFPAALRHGQGAVQKYAAILTADRIAGCRLDCSSSSLGTFSFLEIFILFEIFITFQVFKIFTIFRVRRKAKDGRKCCSTNLKLKSPGSQRKFYIAVVAKPFCEV